MPDGPFITEAKKWMTLDSLSRGFLDKLEEISMFLSGNAQYKEKRSTALKRLEFILKQRLFSRKMTFKLGSLNNDLDVIQDLRKNPDDRNDRIKKLTSKLLTETLSSLEIKAGFNLPSNKAITFLTFMEPKEFREQIQQGKPFKDPTIPSLHGEFTHRIQWYMIMSGVPLLANMGWSDFYKKIGEIQFDPMKFSATFKNVYPSSNEEKDWMYLGLWDALVDRNPEKGEDQNGPFNTNDFYDFRAPENLFPYLTDKKGDSNTDAKEDFVRTDCPLLHEILAARRRKRLAFEGFAEEKDTSSEPELTDLITRGDYYARKLYGVSLNNLNKLDARRIAYIVYKGKNIIQQKVKSNYMKKSAGNNYFQARIEKLIKKEIFELKSKS